ncbi:hypothetical protein HWD99_07215 [Microbacterium sp. C5A9]|uniref:hypothetical protein n=1 Tax=Microbacterium sp. C5A9 TaxID=2736663 RepID=UPI001F51D16B|nr:hypothetical protein [Microbacterium sp. C5A9]MCI1018407.1 hypothetical protein [Microbacterium sp. C5A9]
MMRSKKWGVGLALTAAVLLTGCSAGAEEKPADEKPTAAAEQEETTAPASDDCPELAEGASVDGTALGACITDAMASAAGYAGTTSVLGMESTMRYNPADKAVESISPMGSLIVIGDDVWVKSSTSEWQAADPESSDPVIAALSASAANLEGVDPAEAAGGLTGDFTVTGTGTRLDQEVFLVSGTADMQGLPVDVVYEVTSDYVILASTASADAGGQSIETSMEITEWDMPQDIVAPV